MSTELAIAAQICAVLALVAIGFALRKREIIRSESLPTLSRLVVDVAFPALIVTELVRSVDRTTLSRDLIVPLIGAAVLVVCYGIGLPLGRLIGGARSDRDRFRATTAFLVGTPNWIFLPLLIVASVFGQAGIRNVLLCNVGAQFVLWTFGVAILERQRPKGKNLIALLLNPGLLATAVGILLAVLVPGARESVESSTEDGAAAIAIHSGWSALRLLGSLTVPLSIVVTGAQLGEVPYAQLWPRWDVLATCVGRMIVCPLVVTGLGALALVLDVGIPERVVVIAILIASMPVAVSAGPMAERFGGDVALTARTVLYTTVLSLLTVPAMLFLWERTR